MCVSAGNKIGDEGAIALSQCLTHLPQLTHLNLCSECVYWCVNWFGVWCVICDMCDVWVQTTRLELREQLHWLSAWHTCHNSHTLTCIVSMCIVVLLDVCCVMCVKSHRCVSTGNKIGVEGTKALSQCLTHLTQLTHLDLSCECALMCYLMCDVCFTLMCVWVQVILLELRDQRHWLSAWRIWHNSHSLTCVVSMCIVVVFNVWYGVCEVTLMMRLMHVCEYRQRDWRWGSYCTDSVPLLPQLQ